MAVQYQTQEDQERRRQGENPLISNMPTTTRADRMQAQMSQPVTGPRGVIQPVSAGVPRPPQSGGILSGLAGGAEIVAGGAALPFAVGLDAARGGIARLAGGDPSTLPGGANRYADAASATLSQGIDRASRASDQVKAGTRAALGVQPQSIIDGMSTPAQAAPAVQSTAAPTQAQSIASDMPNQASAPVQADAVGQTQSMITVNGRTPQSIGDGMGAFSQMQPGDSQLALGRFERANQERQRMIEISRRGQIGEGGGRVTVVRDSSRAPSIADIQNARLDARQAQTSLQNQQAQQSILSGMDERLTGQLQRQRLSQEVDQGALASQDQRRLQSLRDQIADPNLGADQREAARSAYTSLSTPAKDRYQSQDIIIGRDENGRDIRGSQLIDVTTGRPVSTGGVSRRMSVTRQEVEQAAKEDGVSIDDYIRALTAQGVAVS
ncbi:hypothetical protein CDR19_04440 [Ectopseudomonas toyotomiensis]|uniref:Uncharacterized protein n=1 Tax=Ectopseudomonas toyotomiensis TaxID=554344 RepID=A0A1I5R4F9_9GAMM|nr:hypothetical protein [Pseudomonas toyotomiensis]PIA74318.1 hypothetical protein CDR19_04440 [Pseudomonas toyotomiensis]SFP52936.1 hypothetical protein SAMN05216177_103268 [Pseudomonas toyotomiensis]